MYKIMVVEDDPVMRKMLSQSLAAEGYESIFAFGAAEALKTCLQERPDLILLDVNLPDGSGIDVCRRLKSDVKLRHIPVLILTGEASSVDCRVEGLEAGADDYVLKPCGVKELMARLKGILMAGVRPTGR